MSSKTYASLHIRHNKVLLFTSNLVHAGFDVVNIPDCNKDPRCQLQGSNIFFKVALVALVSFYYNTKTIIRVTVVYVNNKQTRTAKIEDY